MIGLVLPVVLFLLALIVAIRSIRHPNRRRPRFDPYTQQGLQDNGYEDSMIAINRIERYDGDISVPNLNAISVREAPSIQLDGINHLLYSVSNLERSIEFYRSVFGAKLLAKGQKTAYFDLNGLWLALNVEEEIPRSEIHASYTHIAFSVHPADFDSAVARLKHLKVQLLPGRMRDERDGLSVYFADPDGHKFEFHTGTFADRLAYYKAAKPDMQFFE